MVIYQIVHVVAMGNRFVTTIRSMLVVLVVALAEMLRRTLIGVQFGYFEFVFVYVITMHMVKMAIMQKVDVAVMHDLGMAATCAMFMWMIFVHLMVVLVFHFLNLLYVKMM
jgi:hypothetical protein